jgi:TolB protein
MSRSLPMFLLTAALCVAAVAPAGATLPGADGRIAFARFNDVTGLFDLYTSLADGSQEQLIERDAQGSAWGADQLIYDHETDMASGTVDIFTAHADGSQKHQLTSDAGFNGGPALSPDGSLVAFESDRGDFPAQEGIYVMRADGSGVRRLTSTPDNALYDSEPRFSPDGSRVVFYRLRQSREPHGGSGGRYGPVGNRGAIFVVNVDGTGLRRLTAWGHDLGAPDWSPDGRLIAYNGVFDARPGTLNEIYTMRPDGSDVRQVTHNTRWTAAGSSFSLGSDWQPTWSPSGSRLLYVHFDSTAGCCTIDLWTIRPDGTDAQPAFIDDGYDDWPSWGSVG